LETVGVRKTLKKNMNATHLFINIFGPFLHKKFKSKLARCLV
jgi:hypothetical protein